MLPLCAFASADDTDSRDLPEPAEMSIASDARSCALPTSLVAVTSFSIAGRSSSSANPRARPCALIQSSTEATCSSVAFAVFSRVFLSRACDASSSAAALVAS